MTTHRTTHPTSHPTSHHTRNWTTHRIRHRLIAWSVAATVVAAGCSATGDSPAASPSGTPTGSVSLAPSPASSPSTTIVALPAALVQFGAYTAVPMGDPDSPAYEGPARPTSLTGVQVAPSVREALAANGVGTTLTRQGFVVVPADLRQLHFAYTESAYGGWPVYVTTDAAYHVWHLTFDKILRDIETSALSPRLRTLVSQSLTAAHTQTGQLSGTALADAAARAEQLYQVAAAELGLPVTLGPLARQEKALVDAHAGPATSPLLGTRIDYSLMTPRGHYTRSATLSRYFVAMSVLGQSAFCLPGTQGCSSSDPVRPVRVGLLATRAMLGSSSLTAQWRSIYETTAFLVGLADDYTPAEMLAAATSVAPQWMSNPGPLADDAIVRRVIASLTTTRAVRIDPEKASLRLMGTRFTLDSYVMDQLIAPSVGTNSAGQQRLLPSALDVAAALGSTTARTVLTTSGAMDHQGYREQLAALTSLVQNRPAAEWGGTVYDAWLAALQPVWADHGRAFPDLMRTPAWAAKDLQSGLGSYAQLKHDTILYTKQAVAEGGGDEPATTPRNWVEPEPVAFARLAAAVALLRSGASARHLLTASQVTLLTDVGDVFDLFARTAAGELAGQKVSAADNQALRFIGERLEALWFRTSDGSSSGEPEADTDSAVIADIASGPASVLEVGTGRFDRIYVLVPDDAGRFQVAVGGTYAYYEFAVAAGERLTDTTWRAKLDGGTAPARPSWQSVMMAH
ncbi:MAG: DUF3160 domain-containing protein [Kineosporiaceae bacterium]|nr:DUF3160 domain-containing protein [Kineosporiaceae bacterium]MBK8076129.1 DUF3160 domain-containing protein [Kineosporiaceae bacterium]